MNRLYTFAQRLQMLIDAKQLSKSDIARTCGIDKSNITRYLNGSYEAKTNVVYKIAQRYGVSESWLMGYDVPLMEGADVIHEPYEKLADKDRRLLQWFRSMPLEKQKAFLLLHDAPDDLV
jgi:transcriptional regulator with XRE-family HTH domain